MATNYTGNATPTLSNAPASTWTDDAAKRSHVGNTYLVTGSGSTSGNVYAFEEYPSAVVKEVPASGLPAEIVTITDCGENLPMTSAEVSLSPIQSINGYDHPWAGGANLNKLPPNATDVSTTHNGVTVKAENGVYTFSGTASGNAQISFPLSASVDLSPSTNKICFLNTKKMQSISCYFRRGTTNVHYWQMNPENRVASGWTDSGNEVVDYIYLWVASGTNTDGMTISPMLVELTETTPTTFSPWQNLCPITGHDSATLNIGAEYPAPDDSYPVTFPQTVYGGTFDWVSGKLKVTMANIASYNGETIGEPWLSSMDAYVAGATPTTGAQVVHTITPTETTITPAQVQTLLGTNNVWSDAGEISNLVYRSNQYVMAYDWFETWTMPKITRNNGNIIVLPYPQEYTPEIYDVDASTTGRNAAGTMIRDRVAVKHKFNYKFPPLSQADATEILNAVRDSSFTLTTASPETGAKTNYRVYVGDRSLPVYWMPNHNQNSWLYETVTMNLIEM